MDNQPPMPSSGIDIGWPTYIRFVIVCVTGAAAAYSPAIAIAGGVVCISVNDYCAVKWRADRSLFKKFEEICREHLYKMLFAGSAVGVQLRSKEFEELVDLLSAVQSKTGDPNGVAMCTESILALEELNQDAHRSTKSDSTEVPQ